MGHCGLINLLCKDAGVLPELADVPLKSQSPITDSSMLRLERKDEAGAGAQHVPEAPQQNQAPSEVEYPPMHPTLAEYMFSSAHWMEEASSQLYIEPPRFSQQFSQMSLQYQRPPTGSYLRFGSRESMRGYFQTNRDRAARREQEIELDFNHGESLATATEFVGGEDFGEPSQQDQPQQHDE